MDFVVDWVKAHSDDEKPWHLYYTNILPHPPYEVPQSFYDLYSDDEIPMPQAGLEDEHELDSTHRYSWPGSTPGSIWPGPCGLDPFGLDPIASAHHTGAQGRMMKCFR